jgi:general secretion pathway protein A
MPKLPFRPSDCAGFRGFTPATTMYETHFGLKKRPFRAHARGNDVFIGPQCAATIAGIKKALAAPDGIVAVAGPIGSGKTTLAHRALDGVGTRRTVITVGRMTLEHDEVLELLLEGLGVQDLPPGTVQRFTLFRRKLENLAKDGTRVIVVAEDAARIGVAALSELEALTAADTGASEGAGVVLLGEPDIAGLLAAPELGRLRQRLRLRQTVVPLKCAEMLAYFKHCFRLAGGEFDALFVAGSAELIHALSGGIPRMANNLVESALTAAAERKADQVTVKLIQRVARDEYGLTAEPPPPVASGHRTGSAAVPVAPPATESRPATPAPATTDTNPAADGAPEPDGLDIPELIQDTLPELEILAPQSIAAPSVRDRDHKRGEPPAESAAAKVAATPTPPALGPQPGPASTREKPAVPAQQAEGLAADEIPAWDRDPTLAELRPDLEALEHAMALAHGGVADDPEPEPQAEFAATPPAEPAPTHVPVVPEITLDKQIQAKIDEAAVAIKKTEARAAARAAADAEADRVLGIATAERPAIELPAKPAARPPESADVPVVEDSQPEIPRLEVSKPKVHLQRPEKPKVEQPRPEKPKAEQPRPEKPKAEPPRPEEPKAEPPRPEKQQAEKPAEIKHGAMRDKVPAEEEPDAEFRQIAANLARAKTIDDVDDKMAETLFGEQFSAIAAQVAAKAAAHLSANDDLGGGDDVHADSESAPKSNGASARHGNGQVPVLPQAPGLDESASRRLATVRALNGGPAPAPVPDAVVAPHLAEPARHGQAQAATEQPKSIEEQINTSMTQTLKALSVRPPVDDNEDEDDDEKDGKGGFFGRFRKS